MDLKKVLNKIYKNKLECEKILDSYECDAKHYQGEIKELGNNIIFCEELIDLILGDKDE